MTGIWQGNLHLRETLHDNPLYGIRLSNEKIGDETTGYNKLCDFIAK